MGDFGNDDVTLFAFRRLGEDFVGVGVRTRKVRAQRGRNFRGIGHAVKGYRRFFFQRNRLQIPHRGELMVEFLTKVFRLFFRDFQRSEFG